jgi:hypothetical protein
MEIVLTRIFKNDWRPSKKINPSCWTVALKPWSPFYICKWNTLPCLRIYILSPEQNTYVCDGGHRIVILSKFDLGTKALQFIVLKSSLKETSGKECGCWTREVWGVTSSQNLKGVWHDIFIFWFLSQISFPHALNTLLEPFWIFTKICKYIKKKSLVSVVNDTGSKWENWETESFYRLLGCSIRLWFFPKH